MTITNEVAAAKAVIASHEQFCREGDLAGVLTNIADDVVLVVPNTPLVAGRASFEQVYSDLFIMGRWDFDHDYSGADVVGDVVIFYGVARGTFTPNEGESSLLENNFLLIAKHSGGSLELWKGGFGTAS